VKPYTYPTVAAGLFDAILMQKLPPGDGPEATHHARPVAAKAE